MVRTVQETTCKTNCRRPGGDNDGKFFICNRCINKTLRDDNIEHYGRLIYQLVRSGAYLEADVVEQREMIREVLERRGVFRELIRWRDEEILRLWRGGSGVPAKNIAVSGLVDELSDIFAGRTALESEQQQQQQQTSPALPNQPAWMRNFSAANMHERMGELGMDGDRDVEMREG